MSEMFAIAKRDDEKQIVFGWASVAADINGFPVLDRQGDVIDVNDLEDAVYDYVLRSRSGGEMHWKESRGIGVMVESVVFTPDKMSAMGIPPGLLPYGWWIGLKITDTDVWEKIKSGQYRMFSIEGRAKRTPIKAS